MRRSNAWRRVLGFVIALFVFVAFAGALASSSGQPTRALVLSVAGFTGALLAAGYGVWREHQ